MKNYKRFLTSAEVIDAVLDSDDEGEHEIVTIPPEQGNGNVTDDEEGDENDVANLANTELPNDVARTPEVHKNSNGDDDAITKNSENKSKRKKVIQWVNWKKSTNVTKLPKGDSKQTDNQTLYYLNPLKFTNSFLI